MKRSKTIIITTSLFLVLVLGALSFLSACAGPAPATEPTPAPTPAPEPSVKPIELKFQTMTDGPQAFYTEVWEKWIAEVEKRTEGKVKIKVFFEGQLCPVPATYFSTVSGLLDISQTYPGATPGRFTCLEVTQVPMLDTLPGKISLIPWELYKAFPEFQNQLSEVKVLSLYCTSIPHQGVLATTSKPIRKLEDMKGMKISASGTWPGKTMGALGASAMQNLPSDIYMNLQKKVLDGARIDPEMLEAFKLEEIIDYVTLVNTGYVPFMFIMNKNSWNKLPPDVQKVFEDTGGTFVGDMVDKYTEWHCKAAMDHAAKEYGVEFIELSPEELARWVAVTKPIQQEYVEQMKAKGLPGQALLDMTLKLIEQNRFTGYK